MFVGDAQLHLDGCIDFNHKLNVEAALGLLKIQPRSKYINTKVASFKQKEVESSRPDK